MSTLLLRLAAPLQSWGADSKFETRRTEREPTKSGVIGLLAAALGMRRDADLSALNGLRYGVRVDKEGEILRDFHTARPLTGTPYITYRHYLSDAVFLVGLESSDRAFLETLLSAIRSPVFPLALGRRSCPPTLPIERGIRDMGLENALRAEPWQLSPWRQEKSKAETLRMVVECPWDTPGAVREKDAALSFDPLHRLYGWRFAKETFIPLPNDDFSATSHDPIKEL